MGTRRAGIGLLLMALVCFALPAVAQRDAIARADKLIDEHSEQSYARAIELLQEAREQNPAARAMAMPSLFSSVGGTLPAIAASQRLTKSDATEAT